MQLPVNITYRGVAKSDDIDQLVMDKASRLEKFCDHINRCDVAINRCDVVIDARTLPKIRMPNRDGFVKDPRPDVKPGSAKHARMP
jgi:hypothetical protein